MNYYEVEKSLQKAIGSFPSKTAIKNELGIGNDKVNELVSGLQCFPSGREKRYFVGDIARRIVEAAI